MQEFNKQSYSEIVYDAVTLGTIEYFLYGSSRPVYLLKMSRRTVSQYTNCLLPEDVKTDSVTIHKLSSA